MPHLRRRVGREEAPQRRVHPCNAAQGTPYMRLTQVSGNGKMLGPNLQIITENRISKKGSEAARFPFLATKDIKVGASEEEGLLSLGQVIPPLPSLLISLD